MVDKLEQKIHNINASQPFFVQFSTFLPKSSSEWDGLTRRGPKLYTMPEYLLHPAVASLPNEFAGRKRQLGKSYSITTSFQT